MCGHVDAPPPPPPHPMHLNTAYKRFIRALFAHRWTLKHYAGAQTKQTPHTVISILFTPETLLHTMHVCT